MVDTVKKFSFAGNEKVKTPPKGASPKRGGTEFDMGTGAAGVSELLKEVEAIRSGGGVPDPDFTLGPGSPPTPGPMDAGAGQDTGPARAASDIIPMVESILKNAAKAESDDRLGLKLDFSFDDLLAQEKDIQRQENEELQGSKGIISEFFGLAGLVGGLAGVSNFSPALTLLGGKLSQESKALRDDILKPYQLAREQLYRQMGEEFKGQRDAELDPAQKAAISGSILDRLINIAQKGGKATEELGAKMYESEVGVPPPPSVVESFRLALESVGNIGEQVSLLGQRGDKAMKRQLLSWLNPNTTSYEADEEVGRIRELVETNPEAARPLIREKLIAWSGTEGALGQFGKGEAVFESTRIDDIIDSVLGTPTMLAETSTLSLETGEPTSVIGARTLERAFGAKMMGFGFDEMTETMSVPFSAKIRDKTELLEGVPSEAKISDIVDTVVNNLVKMSQDNLSDGGHVISAPLSNRIKEYKQSYGTGGVSKRAVPLGIKTPVWVPNHVQVFKEKKNNPFNNFEIARKYQDEMAKVVAGDKDDFTPAAREVIDELLGDALKELQR